jgi:hypothetical protein
LDFQGNRRQEDLAAALAASRLRSWRTPVRFEYRIDPPLLRGELLATAGLSAFRPFGGFQGSTVPVPAEVAAALRERAASRLDPF